MSDRAVPRVRRAAVATGIVGLLGGLLGALPTAPTAYADEGAERAPEVEWKPCPEGTAEGPFAAALECASVSVPVDYERPDGASIDIAISRLASAKPDKRRGVLLTNPGGPGGPGLSMPADMAALGLPSSVLDAYDVIGMDARGIGKSAPVSCGFTEDQQYVGALPPYAKNDDEVAARAADAKGIAEQCADNDDAGTLRHVSTVNTARDMDRIRAALGESKINYYGVSYGTALGSAYASMFADRTDRVVLDSNVGGTALDDSALRRFGLGTEQRFPDFAKYAAERDASYHLGATPAEVRKNYFATADQLDERPVAGVDGKLFRALVLSNIYSDDEFPTLAQTWQSVRDGDATKARRLAANLSAENPTDQYNSAQLAVTCNDAAFPGDVATYQSRGEVDRKRFPLYGGASSNVTPCAYWPAPLEPRAEISEEGPSNVLLLQNLRDPATPYVGGQINRREFGDRARLVSVDDGGHGVYLFLGHDNPCAVNATTTYLVEGERPSADTFCEATDRSALKLTGAEKHDRDEAVKRQARTPRLF